MTTDDAIVCTECGRRNFADAVFCATCGRSLAMPAALEAATAPVMPIIEPSVPAPPPSQPGPIDPVTAFVPPIPPAPSVADAFVQPVAAVSALPPAPLPPPPPPPASAVSPAPPAPRTAPTYTQFRVEAPAPATVACTRCGRQNQASATFCEDCGNRLAGPAAFSTPPQPRAASEPVVVGFGKRFAGYLVDTVIYVILWFTLVVVAVAVFGEDGTPTDTTILVGIWAVYFIYHWVASIRGRTLGMALIKMRMMDEKTAEKMPSDRALKRAFMMTLGTTLLGFGLLNMLIDDNKQTWHDKFSHSCVVTAE